MLSTAASVGRWTVHLDALVAGTFRSREYFIQRGQSFRDPEGLYKCGLFK
jgi:hypothetical protein